MSITSYAQLQAAVGKWLARRTDLVDVIPDFIMLAEARMGRKLRLSRQIAVDDVAVLSGVQEADLPASWVEFISLRVDGRTEMLEPTPDALGSAAHSPAQAGAPAQYTVRADGLVVFPVPDTDYTLKAVYYQQVPNLSDNTTSTWLLTAAPDLYLWGALCEAAAFLPGNKRIPIWEQKYAAALLDVQAADDAARAQAGGIRVRAG